MINGREAAFRGLGAYRRGKGFAEALIVASDEKSGISAVDAALAAQILKGVVQNMAYCDYVVSCFSSLELKKLHPRVLDILRISIYQILFLDKIPHSAVVDEGVKLAKKYSNPRAAGFVNAILRKAAESAFRGSLPEVAGENEYQRLALKYSHPEWLVREFCTLLGQDGAEALLGINNSANIPVTAQINTLRTDTETAISMLKSDGIEVICHKWLSDCVEILRPGRLERLVAFRKGCIYIQDAASRMAVMAAEPKSGDLIIDGCAAPGGKSFTAAIMIKGKGRIAAFDINESKLKRVKDGAKRLGINIIEAIIKDSSVQDGGYVDRADVVFADVPCSGLGVIHKKPDIRYKSESDIAGLPDVQRKILSNLSSYVKPGGTLIYSTCTILKRENEDIIEDFLQAHPEFETECFTLPGVEQATNGMTTLWPQIHKTDGFFICKMKRRDRFES